MLTEVKIAGTDRASFLQSWTTKEDFGNNISEAEMVFSSNITVVPQNGDTVTIKRGESVATDQFVFDGYVDEVIKTTGYVTVRAKDKLIDLIRNEVTKSYDSNVDASAGKISDIFKDLVNTFGGGTLVADDVSVQDSGTVTILKKFICNHEDVYKQCQELADLIDWQFYYRADTGLVYFEPKAFLGQNGSLVVGTDLSEGLEWTFDATELVNVATIFGATTDVETTESGKLGTTTGWTAGDGGFGPLNYAPVSVKVYADASDPPTTLRTGGVAGATTTYDYTVDKINKRIVWETDGGYAWAADQYVQVDYTYSIPVPLAGQSPSSVGTYGTHQKTFFFDGIKDVDDAEVKLNEVLEKYSIPFISTVATSLTNITLKPGQTVQVVDSKANEDRILLINNIVKTFPNMGDQIDVGDKTWKTADWQTEVMDRIIELEEKTARVSDFLIHLVNISHSAEFAKCSIKIYSKSIAGITGIYGHPTQGIYGLAYYGRSGMIWGHPIFGIWGEVNWGDVTSAFVLGHPTGGVLGSDELGEGNQTEWVLREEITYPACE